MFERSTEVNDYATQVAPHVQAIRRILEQRNGGYAISAVQVGLPVRFFIAGGRHWDDKLIRVYVNPCIAERAVPFLHEKEGCMSWPGKRRNVERYSHVLMTWEDRFGAQCVRNSKSLLEALVWQHECDHLDGHTLWLSDGSENPRFNVKSEPLPEVGMDVGMLSSREANIQNIDKA